MKIYHVSEEPGIEIFEPRPSPQIYQKISGNVVFAISENMLHNYLLPRDCPRVCYFATTDSTQADIEKYTGNTYKKFIINVEESWLRIINNTKLYLYELPAEYFEKLDEGAGYYISYKTVKPINRLTIVNLKEEIESRSAELRALPSIKELAVEVSKSSLQFSIIRIKNAFKNTIRNEN